MNCLDTGVMPVFKQDPVPFCHFSPALSTDMRKWWLSERERLLSTGAIRQVSSPKYVCSAFVIPKKIRGKFRLIVDSRPLNAFCADLPVRFDSIEDVKLLFNGDKKVRSVASLDVKDGYHHFAINHLFREFFAFHLDGAFYEAACLPFGWN